MTTSLMIDIVTIGLLCATIAYAMSLNRRIQMIHENRDELRDMLNGFSAALEKAEVSVEKLRHSSHESVLSLRSNLDEARQIRDDLEVFVERGEGLTARLEELIRQSRTIDVKELQSQIETSKLGAPRDETEEIGPRDDQILSEVKQKLIGRLKTLK